MIGVSGLVNIFSILKNIGYYGILWWRSTWTNMLLDLLSVPISNILTVNVVLLWSANVVGWIPILVMQSPSHHSSNWRKHQCWQNCRLIYTWYRSQQTVVMTQAIQVSSVAMVPCRHVFVIFTWCAEGDYFDEERRTFCNDGSFLWLIVYMLGWYQEI